MNGLLRAKWLRGALIALLLVAQHGALTHALVHAGWVAHDHSAVQASLHSDEGQPADRAAESCAFDLVYSQVLGGVHGSHDVAFGTAGRVLVVAVAFAPRAVLTVVPYETRGPPVIS